MDLFLCTVILTPWNTWEPSKVTCHLPAIAFPTSLVLALDQYTGESIFTLPTDEQYSLPFSTYTHVKHSASNANALISRN